MPLLRFDIMVISCEQARKLESVCHCTAVFQCRELSIMQGTLLATVSKDIDRSRTSMYSVSYSVLKSVGEKCATKHASAIVFLILNILLSALSSQLPST